MKQRRQVVAASNAIVKLVERMISWNIEKLLNIYPGKLTESHQVKHPRALEVEFSKDYVCYIAKRKISRTYRCRLC